MLRREGQHFPASLEEKHIRDTSDRGDGEPSQQRQKQVMAAASGKCCIDSAGPMEGKRTGPPGDGGCEAPLCLLTTELGVCFSAAGAPLHALQLSSA